MDTEERQPEPKKGMYFPLEPSSAHELLSRLKIEVDGKQLPAPQYLNPAKLDNNSLDGWCLAELFHGPQLCLFSISETVPPSVALDALSLGIPQLAAALQYCPPDKTFEKYSLLLRLAKDGSATVFLRTKHFQVTRFTANKQKFSDLGARLVNVTEKEIMKRAK
jgi:hypothetical protein